MPTKPPARSALEPERLLKTLLLTDLVESTKLVDALGDYRAARLFERHDHLARDLLVKHRGIEIDKTDGFLLLFDRPIDAALFAVGLHDALAELSREEDVRIAARVGMHLGEIVLRKNKSEYVARGAKPLEVEGLAKPMAARIMSLAQGAQTLATRSVFDLARRGAVGNPQAPEDLCWMVHGPYRFKGIVETHVVCELGRKGRAPLTAPPNSEKAWRVDADDEEAAVRWRPAAGLSIPGQDRWRLERKLGEADFGEVWLARSKEMVSSVVATVGLDESITKPAERAFLFRLERNKLAARGEPSSWKLSELRACLVIASGDRQGRFAVLTKEPLLGGRDSTMGLRINDLKVSRQHFEVHPTEHGYVIRELRAKNGVLVNGIRIRSEQRLENADRIRVGETDLVFYEGGYARKTANES